MDTKRKYVETTDCEREGWLCCNKRGDLWLFENKPEKLLNGEWDDGNHNAIYIPKGASPEMTNKSEPVFVKISTNYTTIVDVTVFTEDK